jgi:hypothetical protein
MATDMVSMTHNGLPCQLVTTLSEPGFGGNLFRASNDHSKPAVARFVPASTSCASLLALDSLSSKWKAS